MESSRELKTSKEKQDSNRLQQLLNSTKMQNDITPFVNQLMRNGLKLMLMKNININGEGTIISNEELMD